MTAELIYFCKVNAETGEWDGLPKTKFRKEVARLFGGESIEIIIHKKKKHRSVQQNRYYWLIVTMLSDHTGFTKDELHAILKSKFLRTEKASEQSGLIYEYIKSTTELTTVEYMDYLESVRQFAVEEFDIQLPEPNEQLQVF
jgi:hypothetical protein